MSQGDDAQRDMEQRALRNVRGLLDKMEDKDRLDRKTTVKVAVACLAAVAVLLVIFVAWMNERRSEPATGSSVVIPPPPARK